MPRQAIVWECEHCGKKRNYSRAWIEKHEASCMANPDSKNCYKCIHLGISFVGETYCNMGVENRKSYTAQTCEYYEEK